MSSIHCYVLDRQHRQACRRSTFAQTLGKLTCRRYRVLRIAHFISRMKESTEDIEETLREGRVAVEGAPLLLVS